MFILDQRKHLSKYWFLYGICLSILLAYIYPELGGKEGFEFVIVTKMSTLRSSLGPLRPDWTIKLIGTMIIFLLNGCSIRSEVWEDWNRWNLFIEIRNSIKRCFNIEFICSYNYFHLLFVQLFSQDYRQSIELSPININFPLGEFVLVVINKDYCL